MLETSARLLELLSLLQLKRDWTSSELAGRLDVSTRTVRADIGKLRSLGYPVDAAISEARRGLYQAVGGQKPDWGTPVLFLRAKDGQIFQVEQARRRAARCQRRPTRSSRRWSLALSAERKNLPILPQN